jgi:hypothetical protein
LLGSLANAAVRAADIGGNCCADLEERVAELEATTADKGNRKVTVTLYGRVNRIVNFWDDGVESNTYTLNSSYSPTRWGFRGDAKIGGAWTAGYNLEMEDNRNLSKFVDQFNDNPANGAVIVRRSAMYTANACLLCSGLRKGTTGVRYAHPLAHLPVLISEPASLVQDHRADHEGAKQNCQCTDCVSSHGCKLRVEDLDSAATVSCQGRSIR